MVYEDTNTIVFNKALYFFTYILNMHECEIVLTGHRETEKCWRGDMDFVEAAM